MIIAPLIFATLVAGIAGAGHFKVVGRMGLRAIIYFEVVTTLALLHRPGGGEHHAARASASTCRCGQAQPTITATAQTWDQILLHIVPESVIEAMADAATCCRSSSSASSSPSRSA